MRVYLVGAPRGHVHDLRTGEWRGRAAVELVLGRIGARDAGVGRNGGLNGPGVESATEIVARQRNADADGRVVVFGVEGLLVGHVSGDVFCFIMEGMLAGRRRQHNGVARNFGGSVGVPVVADQCHAGRRVQGCDAEKVGSRDGDGRLGEVPAVLAIDGGADVRLRRRGGQVNEDLGGLLGLRIAVLVDAMEVQCSCLRIAGESDGVARCNDFRLAFPPVSDFGDGFAARVGCVQGDVGDSHKPAVAAVGCGRISGQYRDRRGCVDVERYARARLLAGVGDDFCLEGMWPIGGDVDDVAVGVGRPRAAVEAVFGAVEAGCAAVGVDHQAHGRVVPVGAVGAVAGEEVDGGCGGACVELDLNGFFVEVVDVVYAAVVQHVVAFGRRDNGRVSGDVRGGAVVPPVANRFHSRAAVGGCNGGRGLCEVPVVGSAGCCRIDG